MQFQANDTSDREKDLKYRVPIVLNIRYLLI